MSATVARIRASFCFSPWADVSSLSPSSSEEDGELASD